MQREARCLRSVGKAIFSRPGKTPGFQLTWLMRDPSERAGIGAG